MSDDDYSNFDDDYSRDDRNYSINRQTEHKSNVGCWVGGCGTAGCALIIGGFFFIIGGLAFILFLTPVPMNFVADALEKENKNVRIGTVSGNIMKGFSVPYVEFPDEKHPDRINKLENIKFLYPNLLKGLRKNEIDFEEITVGSATLYVDYDGSNTIELDEDGIEVKSENSTSVGDSADSVSSEASDFELFRLRKVDIKNIELIDPEKDFRFILDELTLDGLEVTPDHFKMGQFTIRSSVLDFSMSPIDVQSGSTLETSSKLELSAKLQPNKELNVLKPITLDGHIEFLGKDNLTGKLEGIDGKVQIEFTENKKEATLKVEDLSLSEYFDVEYLLPSKINWAVTLQDQKDDVQIVDSSGGTFYLGDAMFTVEDGIQDPAHVLKAVHKGEEDTLTLLLNNESASKDNKAPFELTSENNPDRSQQDLLADLFYDKSFDELEEENQKRVLKTLWQDKKDK